MPSKSSKQNSGHSLEDMLEQLETVERDYESEPQVLDDGRIKVKKRKRRTKQAVHAKRKKRRIRSIALASLLLLGLLSAFLASKRMTHFYQSNEFLTSLEEQLSQNLQGDVKLKGLSSQNGEIYLNSLTVNSLNASNVKRAYFENLSSKINPWAWTKKRWDLKRLHAEKGRIELDATNPVATAGASIGSGFMENNSPAEPDLAVALTVQKIEVDDFAISWNSETDSKVIENSLLYGSASGKGWDVHLRDGTLKGKNIKPLAILYANGYADAQELQIREAKFNYQNVVEAITVQGNLSSKAGINSQLTFTLKDLPTAQILNAPWAGWIDGKLSGEFRYSQSKQDDAASLLKGICTITEARLNNLPGLEKVAKTTENPFYANIELETPLQFEYSRSGNASFIKSISGAVEGLFSIKGDLNWQEQGKNLGGKLFLGLQDDAFDRFQGGIPSFFAASMGEGLRWAEINLGGRLQQPQNDFAAKIDSLKKARRTATAEKTPTPAAPAFIPDTSAQTAKIIEEAQRAINKPLPTSTP